MRRGRNGGTSRRPGRAGRRPGPAPTAARPRGRSRPSPATAARRRSRRRWTPRPCRRRSSRTGARPAAAALASRSPDRARPRASEIPMLYARDAVFGPYQTECQLTSPTATPSSSTTSRSEVRRRRAVADAPVVPDRARVDQLLAVAAADATAADHRVALTAEPAPRRAAARRQPGATRASGAHRVVTGAGGVGRRRTGVPATVPVPHVAQPLGERLPPAARRTAAASPGPASLARQHLPGRRRRAQHRRRRPAPRHREAPHVLAPPHAPAARRPRRRRRPPPTGSPWCAAGCAPRARWDPRARAGRRPST